MILNDVTLREGDQLPGRSYSAEQKIACGEALDRLGVGFVQPGFPVTGEKDQRVTRELAGRLDADVIGLARAVSGDVEAALDAEADVVEVFVPGSDAHLEHMLGATREEALDMVDDATGSARDAGVPIHVTLTDGFRTDPERVVEAATRFDYADYVTLADTVGARTPASVRPFLGELTDQGLDLGRAGVHFHDDLGVATANALEAMAAGVGKADVSVASLGERAGNSALEEVVVAAAVDCDVDFGIDETELVPVCREVLDRLGETIDPRKSILGDAVSEHESGIHTAVMLDEPSALEAFPPERFGGERQLLFGDGTGTGGARRVLERADATIDDATVERFLDLLATEGPVDLDEAISLARREFK